MPDCCINLLATAIRIAYEGNPCSHLLHPEFVEGIRVSSATMHQDPDTWKKIEACLQSLRQGRVSLQTDTGMHWRRCPKRSSIRAILCASSSVVLHSSRSSACDPTGHSRRRSPCITIDSCRAIRDSLWYFEKKSGLALVFLLFHWYCSSYSPTLIIQAHLYIVQLCIYLFISTSYIAAFCYRDFVCQDVLLIIANRYYWSFTAYCIVRQPEEVNASLRALEFDLLSLLLSLLFLFSL